MRRGKIKANNSEMSSPASAASFAVLPRKSNNGGLKALIPIFLVISLAVFAVWYATERVPSVRSSASTPLHQFSEERAVDFLRYLLDNFGYSISLTTIFFIFFFLFLFFLLFFSSFFFLLFLYDFYMIFSTFFFCTFFFIILFLFLFLFSYMLLIQGLLEHLITKSKQLNTL